MGIETDTMRVYQDSGVPARLSQKRTFLERQMIPGCTNVGVTPRWRLGAGDGNNNFVDHTVYYCLNRF